jgi:hypothetical protein
MRRKKKTKKQKKKTKQNVGKLERVLLINVILALSIMSSQIYLSSQRKTQILHRQGRHLTSQNACQMLGETLREEKI